MSFKEDMLPDLLNIRKLAQRQEEMVEAVKKQFEEEQVQFRALCLTIISELLELPGTARVDTGEKPDEWTVSFPTREVITHIQLALTTEQVYVYDAEGYKTELLRPKVRVYIIGHGGEDYHKFFISEIVHLRAWLAAKLIKVYKAKLDPDVHARMLSMKLPGQQTEVAEAAGVKSACRNLIRTDEPEPVARAPIYEDPF